VKRVSCDVVLRHIRAAEKEPHHKAQKRRAPYSRADLCKLTWTVHSVSIEPRRAGDKRGMHVEPHSPQAVARYAKRIAAGERPPAVVLIDQTFFYEIADGAHRIAAARAAGLKRLPAFVGKPRR
jgi:hypothetical protein